MCYVSYQIDRHLAQVDRAEAREYWLGMKAQDDSYGLYLDDAMECLDGHLSAADNAIMEDGGLYALLSAEGKEAVLDRAQELAFKDDCCRYE